MHGDRNRQIAAGQFPPLSPAYCCFTKLENNEKEVLSSGTIISSKQKTFCFTFRAYYKTLIRMHKMCEWIHSTVPTHDLLQVEEVKASFLAGWALGNGVKNEFVQETE